MPMLVEILLDAIAKAGLGAIVSHIDREGLLYDPNADLKGFNGEQPKIFPMSKDAFEQAWNGLVKRSGIPSKEEDAKKGIPEHAQGLQFLDLRREAGSRFNAADLNSDQHDLMLGHNLNNIRGVYIAPAPSVIKAICDKLDRYTARMTKDEFDKQFDDKKARDEAITKATNVVAFTQFKRRTKP